MIRHYRISIIMGIWVISLALGLVAGAGRTETIWLSSLDLSKAKVTDQVRPAVDKTINGNTLTINKRTYGRGVCVNGYTVLYVQLNGGSDKFSAILGVDDESLVPPTPPAGAAAQTGRAGAGQGSGGRGGTPTPTMSVRILADENRVLYENNSIPSRRRRRAGRRRYQRRQTAGDRREHGRRRTRRTRRRRRCRAL